MLIDSVWIPDPRRTRSTRNCNLKIPAGSAEPFDLVQQRTEAEVSAYVFII